MDDKSLGMLDFPKIKELLAGYTGFSASREMALALTPLFDYDRVTLLLKLSSEARLLFSENKGYTIGSTLDIRDKAKLAALEGVLDPPSLMEVQQTLNALHELRRYLKSIAEECPLIWSIAEGIADLQQVEKDIAACLSPDGEVLDTASPSLANIRAQLRDSRSQILEKLEDIVKSPQGHQYFTGRRNYGTRRPLRYPGKSRAPA